MNTEANKTGPRPTPSSHSRNHSYSHTSPRSLGTVDVKLFSTQTAKTAKGKLKEEENCFGWWDYAPLLEAHKPPLQWTSSSLIITAHATEPRVVCVHFPSNKHFTLPSAPSLAASPTSYEPPTILSASARDDWIFAYFPGIDIDGAGCLWNRSHPIDEWAIKDWRTFSRGDAVVAARWLNPEREWASTDSGSPVKLPTLGPFIPLLNPIDQVKMLSVSLSRRSSSREGQERPPGERVDGARGLGRCVRAAIGFGYDESSILVATHSSFVPSAASESTPSSTADLTMSLSMNPPILEPVVTSEWETWRDESIIEVCEVSISIQGFLLSLVTTPLPYIRNSLQPNRSLTDLTFVPSLPSLFHMPAFPSTPTQTHRYVTPQSSPASVHAHVSQSPGRAIHRSPAKGTPPKPAIEKMKGKPMSALYLLCTTLDLGQYTETPKSDVTLYIFWRNLADLAVQTWVSTFHIHYANLSIIVHTSPSQPSSSPQYAGALLGVLDTKGQVLKGKERHRLSVGRLQMIRLPELQIDENWDSTNIVCSVGSHGPELPFSMAVSPNRTLVCAVPSSTSLAFTASTSIYSHPSKVLHAAQDFGTSRAKKQLSASLEMTIQRRIMPGDVVHLLTKQSTPISVVEEVLANVLSNFNASNNGLTGMWTNELLGTAVEIYHARSLSSQKESEKGDFLSRYQVGHEICSLKACNDVWEDTYDSKGYDINAVWCLTSLCSYFIEILEKLLKECVEFAGDVSLLESLKSAGGTGEAPQPLASPKTGLKYDNNPFTGRPPLKPSPIDLNCSLTHLIHPYTLDNLYCFLQHVRRFRAYLGAIAKQDEHHQMAKEMLIDIVDSSGIDLEALDRVLSDIRDEVKANAERDPDLARRCLVSLKPPSQYATLLQKFIVKIMQAQLVDKSRLFIKPDDLVDSILGLSVGEAGTVPDSDVISKGLRPRLKPPLSCVRCSGKSEINNEAFPGHASAPWLAWERSWQTHLIDV
ncbi:hypothetical protein EW145_g1983 [Phellinidium pouzarii]|uniref:Uncharacterized protein n=1 Tax=Phellinidium pouzarii TaxID=167371 RepID=A0A4S4LCZ7_9AGAM|nr:hypothetical protein EW145_g1983 [Phellinidium pouzarii]